MPHSHKHPIVIVLGMHRSGTSMAAGLLHQSGISMGRPDEFFPPLSAENAKGFYENHRFRVLNDQLLEAYGYAVKRWNPQFHRPSSDMRDTEILRLFAKPRIVRRIVRVYVRASHWMAMRKIKALLTEFCQLNEPWGWKDPRQMLTMPEWISTLDALQSDRPVKVLFIFRNPISVANSLIARKSVKTLSHGLSLWQDYNQTALNDVDQLGLDALFLPYEHFFNNPDTVISGLNQFLGTHIQRAQYDAFVSPDLNRQGTASQALDAVSDPSITTLYNTLLQRVTTAELTVR